MKLPPEEQLIRHARTLQALHLPGGDLRFDSPWATRRRPEWHKPSKPRRERAAVLHRLIGEWAAGRPEALAERRALVLAGPPGAGKTSRRGEALAALGEDPAGYAVIDSDVFKELLIREALRDGTWPQLVPDSVWQREADGERFYPMELSALFHSEAAILVMYAQMKWVLPAGVNVVLEGVHPNPAAATRMVALLDSYDYQVATATVETAERECLVRSVARWAAGYAAAEEGEPGAELGGRWLPSEPIHGLFADGEKESRCSATASAVAEAAHSCGRHFGTVHLTAAPPPDEEEQSQLRAASERIRDALDATSDH